MKDMTFRIMAASQHPGKGMFHILPDQTGAQIKEIDSFCAYCVGGSGGSRHCPNNFDLGTRWNCMVKFHAPAAIP
jgi:hypothetical protein